MSYIIGASYELKDFLLKTAACTKYRIMWRIICSMNARRNFFIYLHWFSFFLSLQYQIYILFTNKGLHSTDVYARAFSINLCWTIYVRQHLYCHSLCMHFKSMKRKLGCLCLLLCPKITFARSEARIAWNIMYKQIILFIFADLNLPHSHCRNPTRGDTYKWAQYDTWYM